MQHRSYYVKPEGDDIHLRVLCDQCRKPTPYKVATWAELLETAPLRCADCSGPSIVRVVAIGVQHGLSVEIGPTRRPLPRSCTQCRAPKENAAPLFGEPGLCRNCIREIRPPDAEGRCEVIPTGASPGVPSWADRCGCGRVFIPPGMGSAPAESAAKARSGDL